MVQWMSQNYEKFNKVFYKIFKDEKEMIDYATNQAFEDGRSVWALVNFNTLFDTDVDFTIRTNYTAVPTTKRVMYWRVRGIVSEYQKYIYSGFLTIQRSVEEYIAHVSYQDSIAELHMRMTLPEVSGTVHAGSYNHSMTMNITGGSTGGINVNLGGLDNTEPQSFSQSRQPVYLNTDVLDGLGTYVMLPYPTATHEKNQFYEFVGPMMGMVMCMSMLYPVARLTKSIVEEKETRMREVMRIMGLMDWVLASAWSLTYLIVFLSLIHI